MRIRKNLKLLNLSPYPLDAIDYATQPAAAASSTPTICKLNQSPWDVIPFNSPNSSSFQQLERDEFNLYGDAQIGGSIDVKKQSDSQFDLGAWINGSFVEKKRDFTPNSLMHSDNSCCYNVAKKMKRNEHDGCDGSDDVEMYDEPPPKKKKNGKDVSTAPAREQCERKNKNSEKAPLSSGNNSNGAAKCRTRGPKKNASTGPYDFYYYEGFGPRWGKKRGEERNDRVLKREKSASGEDDTEIRETVESERFVVDIEDEQEEENGKKRARKPVKARSLKSIM